jgi:lipopolysaccharide/colanic/teichoic acid biosynthesis glycosyltransferase
MGCNCKATEHILKVHKKYGREVSVPWSEKIKFNTEEIIKMVLAFVLSIIFSPIMLIILIVFAFQGKSVININNILYKLLKHKKK